ncbi:caspase family protein [Amycolatopsis thermalba]|uniref:Caspase family protein n=1 Tax=Amycolatopsis thermalba TaxID=944492 RepID=A0ABY4NU92_9PSEU|nr:MULTISPECIES: caspase family protein [Amycolatopsis]UQS23622.1 caspase family protein [Amycolatopsis thermalba]
MTARKRRFGAVGERRIGLVITTDTYADETFRQLDAPKADAEALQAVLADPRIGRYDVTLLHNAAEHEVRIAIDDLFSEARPDDLVLLYVSGHGVKGDDGRLYFVMRNSNSRRLQSTAIDGDWVREQMERSRSRRIVVLLDCCYAGAFLVNSRHRTGERVDVVPQLRGRGRAVITSSSAVQYSYEVTAGATPTVTGSATPSIFTGVLVEGLRTGDADKDNDGLVDVEELYDYVYDHVRQSGSPQRPQAEFGIEGTLYIAASPVPGTSGSHPADVVDLVAGNSNLKLALLEGIELRGGAGEGDEEVLARLAGDPEPAVAARARALLTGPLWAGADPLPGTEGHPMPGQSGLVEWARTTATSLTTGGASATAGSRTAGDELGAAAACAVFAIGVVVWFFSVLAPFVLGSAFGRITDLTGLGIGNIAALVVSVFVVGLSLSGVASFWWTQGDLDIYPSQRLLPGLLVAGSASAGVMGTGWLGAGTVTLLGLALAGAVFADSEDVLAPVPAIALALFTGVCLAVFPLPVPLWAIVLGIAAVAGTTAAMVEFAKMYWTLCFIICGLMAYLHVQQPHWRWLDELGRTVMNWLVWRF